jgi:undecaprenyl-diphosphatase
MQLGTLWAPLVIALAIGGWRKDWLLAGCLVVADAVTWIGARIVKEAVERGRPAVYLPDVDVRDGVAVGFGYLSGHSAMAAMSAVVCTAAVPRRYRGGLVVVAILVGVARIVHGVHLPADVVGGWAFGALVGVATLAVYDRLSARAALEPRAGVHPS